MIGIIFSDKNIGFVPNFFCRVSGFKCQFLWWALKFVRRNE